MWFTHFDKPISTRGNHGVVFPCVKAPIETPFVCKIARKGHNTSIRDEKVLMERFYDDYENYKKTSSKEPTFSLQQPIYDGETITGDAYIVLPKLHVSLNDVLVDNDLSVQSLCKLGYSLTEFCCFMNENGVLHNDIKADNIMFSSKVDGNINHTVIIDFGACATVSVPVVCGN